MHLCKPSGATLGRYLRTCRVKVIDSDTFPSSKYESQLLRGKQGVSEIRTIGLLWEYWKLCFRQLPGIGKRSCLVVFLDQFRNAYRVILLALNMYMVDVLFNTGNPDTEKHLIGGGFDQLAFNQFKCIELSIFPGVLAFVVSLFFSYLCLFVSMFYHVYLFCFYVYFLSFVGTSPIALPSNGTPFCQNNHVQ